MKEEKDRIVTRLRQTVHIRDYLWHRYFAMANQQIMATIKLTKSWLKPDFQEQLIKFTIFKGLVYPTSALFQE